MVVVAGTWVALQCVCQWTTTIAPSLAGNVFEYVYEAAISILSSYLLSSLMGCAFLIGQWRRIPLEVNRLTTGPKVDTLARGGMGQAIGSKNV